MNGITAVWVAFIIALVAWVTIPAVTIALACGWRP